ncbi:MAG: UbiD family decarboxylase, partial [Treponema sp.]|nr:UbiD family decarboxylase [Treponema sp.]
YPGSRIVIGVLASRQRAAKLLGCDPARLGFLLKDAVNHAMPPVLLQHNTAPCQEVVHRADAAGFDIRTLLPAPSNTLHDAGPYITLGMCYATHPDSKLSDITIHRLCLQGKDEISIFFTPGARHIGAMAKRAEELNIELPITVSIGVDPAIEIASCFEPPTTPLGFNELSIAGAIRNAPVEMAQALSVPEKVIANAEYVIEGVIVPGIRVREDQNSNTGFAMPEFPGYTGPASDQCSLIKVKALTHRNNPIMQTCIGPSEEHVSMAGIPTEASILDMVEKALPGRLLNVYAHPSGGGKYLAILQFRKAVPSDEGRQRQAALLALSAFSELKHVILVDEDVDIFDTNDVLWALNTRYQGDRDTIFIPGVRCHPLDPSQSPEYNPSIINNGISCKTVFDCTVPFPLKEKFVRAQFMDVDFAAFLSTCRPAQLTLD